MATVVAVAPAAVVARLPELRCDPHASLVGHHRGCLRQIDTIGLEKEMEAVALHSRALPAEALEEEHRNFFFKPSEI